MAGYSLATDEQVTNDNYIESVKKSSLLSIINDLYDQRRN